MRIFKKKIEFVSKEEYIEVMANITDILDGMTIASRQQAQMLASIANQLSMVHAKKKLQKEKKAKVNDPSFQ